MVTQQHGDFAYVGDALIRDNVITLSTHEAHHLLRVRRVRAGGEVLATDGRGCVYRTKLCANGELEITEMIPEYGETKLEVSLICGCLQGDAARDVVSTAVQLGVKNLYWVRMIRSQEAYSENKLEKLERVAIHSTKQTGRAHLLKQSVSENLLLGLAQLPSTTLWVAHPDNSGYPLVNNVTDRKSLALVIGPEGGFDESELDMLREHGASFLGLGTRRLRSEIAVAAGLVCLLTNFDEL